MLPAFFSLGSNIHTYLFAIHWNELPKQQPERTDVIAPLFHSSRCPYRVRATGDDPGWPGFSAKRSRDAGLHNTLKGDGFNYRGGV